MKASVQSDQPPRIWSSLLFFLIFFFAGSGFGVYGLFALFPFNSAIWEKVSWVFFAFGVGRQGRNSALNCTFLEGEAGILVGIILRKQIHF